MARYTAGALTSAGSTVLPLISLYSAAAVGAKVREVSVTNTTSTVVAIRLVRLTTQATVGAGLTEGKHDPDSAAASCTAFNTHSTNPAVGDDMGYRTVLGAAVGAAYVFTFWNDSGLRISVGTANGIGVIVENGAGQPLQASITWDE